MLSEMLMRRGQSAKATSVALGETVFIRDLVVEAFVGVFEHERRSPQPIRINIEIDVFPHAPGERALNSIVRYDLVAQRIVKHVASGHVELVETLAEQVADICLSYDPARVARVSVEKPNAIGGAASAGVRLIRETPREMSSSE